MNPRTLILSISIASAPLSLPATELSEQALEQLKICHEYEQSSARLTCYDTQSEYIAPEPKPAPSAWVFIERSDPVTGDNTSYVYLGADVQHNGRDSPSEIIVRCDGDGDYDLYVRADGYIGGNRGRVLVTYRWGENEPIVERWNDSTTGKAAFLPNGYRDFLAGLRTGGELAFQWEDFRGTRYASTWSNIQLDENVEYILGGCN